MKAPSDSTLNNLWRQAVLHAWGVDPISGCGDWDKLQCHHFVRRKHYVTRWDWRNGIPLTAESHRFAHTGAGDRLLASILHQVGFLAYLEDLERTMKKDYLLLNGMSDADFRLQKKQELGTVIAGKPMMLGHNVLTAGVGYRMPSDEREGVATAF